MCGRFSFSNQAKAAISALQQRNVPTSLNIAPTHEAVVFKSMDMVQTMTWGLVPHWQKDGKNSGALINARVEDICEKPSFRVPIQQQRCIVPADSFYEWRTEGKQRIPYRIHATNHEVLWMAGIWDTWTDGNIKKETFSILTTTPNQEMKNIHDRMPIFLQHESQQQEWLYPHNVDNFVDNLLLQFKNMPDGLLKMYRVNEKMNHPSFQADDIHQEVAEPLRLF
jgi:putative SOS response-associated peptidase YedK